MDIWNTDKLILFVAFFVPGFIALKVYDLLVPGEVRNPSQSIIEAVAYSCINYALFSWLLLLDIKLNLASNHPTWHGIIIFLVLFIFPIGLAFGYWNLRNANILKKYSRHPIPKPWDYIFGKQMSYWIIIELIDNNKIGGIYDTNSFASSFPFNEQLYLQEEWEVDGHQFVKPIERSSGILVSAKDIKSIRFYE